MPKPRARSARPSSSGIPLPFFGLGTLEAIMASGAFVAAAALSACSSVSTRSPAAAQAAPLAAAVPAAEAGEVRVEEDGRLSMIQGVTTATTTQVAVLVPRASAYAITLREEGLLTHILPVDESRVMHASSAWAVQKARFAGLRLGTRYELEVTDREGRVLDSRGLATLDLARPGVRAAMLSCMSDEFRDHQLRMFGALLEQKPELVFLVGDNVYADKGQVIEGEARDARIWRRYVETWRAFELFKTRNLVPVLATWDDHDYGEDNSDSSFPYKEQSAQVFKAFFAQDREPGALETGPGVSSLFRAFGQRFFLMDNRTFRSPNNGSGEQTHWGAEQERWLYSRLRESGEPAWIMSGSQFFGGYLRMGESYEHNHPQSFRAFLGELSGIPAPVVFVSGDRHFTELQRIESDILGYETFELTTSGFLSKHLRFVWAIYKNRRQLEGVDSFDNFAMVEARSQGGKLQVAIAAVGAKGKVAFARRLEVSRPAPPAEPRRDRPFQAPAE